MILTRLIDPNDLRKLNEVIYKIQRLIMSSQIPDIIRRTLIDELQTVIEDFKHHVPEKQLKLKLAKEIPARIREFSQVFIDQLQLPMALSDKARDACRSKKKILESGEILPEPRFKKDKFLHNLLQRFYVRSFKKLTKHIPINVRSHLSLKYRLPSDYYDHSIPKITGVAFIVVIRKIHGELRRLQRLYKLYDLVFNCPLTDVWNQKPAKTSSHMEIFKHKKKNLLKLLDKKLIEIEVPSMPEPKIKRKSSLSTLTIPSWECTPPPTPPKEASSPSSSGSSITTKCTIFPSASSFTRASCQCGYDYNCSIINRL